MKQIMLDEHLFIGKGHDRACYRHPENDLLCIKVLHTNSSAETKAQLKREIAYNRLLFKRKVPKGIVSFYQGEVETNKGAGYVFELVRDFDGKISTDLLTYLQTNDDYTEIALCMKELKQSLLKYNIVTMDLFSQNILCQRLSESEMKLVIIDDIGTAVLIKLEYYFGFAAKARVERKWKVLLETIKRRVQSPQIDKLVEEVR